MTTQLRTILVLRPNKGGVASVALRAASELKLRRWDVTTLRAPSGPGLSPQSFRFLWEALRRARRADVVHAEFGALDHCVFAAALLLALLRRDIALVAHDAPRLVTSPAQALLGTGFVRDRLCSRVLAPIVDSRTRRWLLKRAGVTLVLSESALVETSDVGASPCLRVHHGADPPTAPSVPPSRGRHVLFAGYIGPGKGLDVLVAAWALAGPASPVPLMIVGAPADRASHDYTRMTLLHARSLGATVEIVGMLPDESFNRAVADSAIVVLPYRTSNPASGILIRAMSEGRAVITTPIPAAAELVEDGTSGRVVPPGDPVALASALRELLADPNLRNALGAEAANRARQLHSWKRHVDDLEAGYSARNPGVGA